MLSPKLQDALYRSRMARLELSNPVGNASQSGNAASPATKPAKHVEGNERAGACVWQYAPTRMDFGEPRSCFPRRLKSTELVLKFIA